MDCDEKDSQKDPRDELRAELAKFVIRELTDVNRGPRDDEWLDSVVRAAEIVLTD